ncbi:P-loop containing nucleoside triphosphate hydrolase [Pseudocohnilembus persalinus]|uniref:p-loop containing nucleoside triphosphate hydrolase n=1 Tax=Pseudocohnilembus persalinus TaxID=266149 RepID=A0A0V0R2N2_PSEPJ|nr:P-loop containing nucleoside triphosphate hydrolase [Pseudocohnilembus persalinus]|eukprot:KRX08759.1 P-loop containing nucleoside triphosphate hydrolase [Pseudocohnilembus persalinus]
MSDSNELKQSNYTDVLEKDQIKIAFIGLQTAVGKSTLVNNFKKQEVLEDDNQNPTIGIDFQSKQFYVGKNLLVTYSLYEFQDSLKQIEKMPSTDVIFLVFDKFGNEFQKKIEEKINQIQQTQKQNKFSADILLIGNDRLDMKITCGKEKLEQQQFIKDNIKQVHIINFNNLKEVNELFVQAYLLKQQKKSQYEHFSKEQSHNENNLKQKQQQKLNDNDKRGIILQKSNTIIQKNNNNLIKKVSSQENNCYQQKQQENFREKKEFNQNRNQNKNQINDDFIQNKNQTQNTIRQSQKICSSKIDFMSDPRKNQLQKSQSEQPFNNYFIEISGSPLNKLQNFH